VWSGCDILEALDRRLNDLAALNGHLGAGYFVFIDPQLEHHAYACLRRAFIFKAGGG
jgi:hypothetical protein